ncbi:MAG TPA: O-methyltransferase [Steroidobacteraceae bacterium]|jgi:predicted O-methyltransferase YrrM|nr:O-methyltransferase [Steroidobacteraceae bacterium]
MDEAVSRVLAEYEKRIAAEEQAARAMEPAQMMARLDEFLLPIGPDTGRLVHMLIKSAKARSILELGTSYGYSTLWLADAARQTDGRVISLELAEYKAAYARGALERAGLSDRVQIHVGSALETLPRLQGPFDFVLVDLWKDLYVKCLDLVYPKLIPGAFLAADNMIYPPEVRADAERYRVRVRQLEFDSILLPVGSGIELSRRR